MMSGEFHMSGDDFLVTDEVLLHFKQQGYVLVRGLLDTTEINMLRKALETDSSREKYSFKRDDGLGLQNKYYVWNHPNDDITGMVARCEKVVGTIEKLLGGEVYHYHSKLIQKNPKTGGAFNWHQDYGYWYHNGCLYPDMGTVYVAIDRADKSNGCLTIIPGSHLMGRVDHIAKGDEVAADPDRVQHAVDKLGKMAAEMNAGDVLFFHSNLLHCSDQNHSDKRRWALNIAYNRASNNPVKEHHHPKYTKLNKVPNSSIKEAGIETSEKGKDYMHDTKSELQDLSSHSG